MAKRERRNTDGSYTDLTPKLIKGGYVVTERWPTGQTLRLATFPPETPDRLKAFQIAIVLHGSHNLEWVNVDLEQHHGARQKRTLLMRVRVSREVPGKVTGRYTYPAELYGQTFSLEMSE
jgi:hypothetical protein